MLWCVLDAWCSIVVAQHLSWTESPRCTVGEVLGVAAPTGPSGLLLGCVVRGVLSSSTAIVSHVVTTDVAAPEYDNNEGGSFAFETFNFDQALES